MATVRVIPAGDARAASIQARHDYQRLLWDARHESLPAELGDRWWPSSAGTVPQNPASARPFDPDATAGGLAAEWSRLMVAVEGRPVLVDIPAGLAELAAHALPEDAPGAWIRAAIRRNYMDQGDPS